MSPPTERKRRFHRRSKNGCQTCKRRHVRCDERTPLCSNCLQSVLSDYHSYAQQTLGKRLPAPINPLNDYVGGSFDELSEPSKRLLQHFSQFAVEGQKPVVRDLESPAIHKAFQNPGYMHMCLMLSACQWAWITGRMDEVQIPFLYHKAATYQFAREQLQRPETAQSGDTILAISALALAEGAVGELDASSRHLRGIRSAMAKWQGADKVPTLPQRLLKMVGAGLRMGISAKPLHVPEYQPTFMALVFASLWDVTALPPQEAPKYGWWEDQNTQAARLWQTYTKELNLNYEISRDFNTDQIIPHILNGDPKSSRTSFIATFFYLCSELGHRYLDVTLIDWLLEQLIDDVNVEQERLHTSEWTQPLWLWCVMFGAAVARTGRAKNPVEGRQLARWISIYNVKLRLASQILGFSSWQVAANILVGVVEDVDEEIERGLEMIWKEAVGSEGEGEAGVGAGAGADTPDVDQGVIELMTKELS